MRPRLGLWLELGLIWLCLVGWLQVNTASSGWWQLLGIWAIFVTLDIIVSRRNSTQFSGLLIVAFLAGLGWITLYRLDSAWAYHQWTGWLLASGSFLVAFFLNWKKVRYTYVFGIVAILLLVATGLFGVEIGGARAWLRIGAIRFQPVEFARVFFILFLAGFFVDNQRMLEAEGKWPQLGNWGPLLILVAGIFLFLGVQRDLGPALLFFLVFISLSLFTVFTWRLLFLYFTSICLGLVTAWFGFAHFRARLLVWLNPWEYLNTIGYQVVQGIFAFSAGGFFGTGLGYGQGSSIPAVHTDYIFPLIAEELGFLGSSLVVMSYLLLTYWGFRVIAGLTGRPRLIALGISLTWAFQSFLVIGGTLKVIPLTGMTLPFVSYGTSSLVANAWMFGMLTSLEGTNNAE